MRRVVDAPPSLALAIVSELVELGDHRAIPALVSCIKSNSESVRGEALYGIIALSQARSSALPDELVKFGDPTQPSRALTQIVYPADLEAVAILHENLSNKDPEMRIAAAYGLGSMGALNAHDKLRHLALTDTDEDVQTAATYAMGQLVDHGCKDSLATIAFIGSTNTLTEPLVAVLRTLIAYQPEVHVDVFERCLNHTDDRLRQLGVIGLGRSKTPDAQLKLAKMLQDQSPHVKRVAAHALGQVAEESSIAVLIESGVGGSSELRAAIASSLKAFPRKAVEHALLGFCVSNKAKLRAFCAYLAAKLEYQFILEKLLTDPDPVVRKQATLGLSDLPQSSREFAVNEALRALHDEHWKVRVAAVETIRRLGDQGSIRRLSAFVKDPNHVVRQAIRRTLDTF